MRRRVLFGLGGLLILLALPARAQQTVKRSEIELLPVAPLAEVAPRPWGPYDFHTSVEFGGQFSDVHGNEGVYRTQNNYRDGLRVFTFRVDGKARDTSAFFTRVFLEGSGWGGDPYNWARYGLRKDRWLDFTAAYYRSDYFFAFPVIARGQHLTDQERRRQNYEMTLFPQRRFRVHFGYSRNSSFSTPSRHLATQVFSGDQFVLFEPLRQTYDEWRLGADWNVQRWAFFFDSSWRLFRNDRLLTLPGPAGLNNPGNTLPPDTAALTALVRSYPARGRFPSVRFTLAGRPHDTLDISAQFVYSWSKFESTRAEFQAGQTFTSLSPPGPAVPTTNTFDSFGRATRPHTTVDLAVVWRPVSKLTFSDTFRFDRLNRSGTDLTNFFTTCGAPTALLVCAPGPFGDRSDNRHRLRYESNRLEVRYEVAPWLAVRAGERYTHRSANQFEIFTDCGGAFLPGCRGGNLSSFEVGAPANRVSNTFLLGARFRPAQTFSVFLDYERGGLDSIFNRIRRGTRVTTRLRARWEPIGGVRLNAAYFLFDLSAPDPALDSFQHNRGVSADFSFFGGQRYYWDFGYARNDVSSFTVVGRETFLALFQRVDGPSGADCTLIGVLWVRSDTSGPCRPVTYLDHDNYAYMDFGGRIVRSLHGEVGYRVFAATGTYPPSDPETPCRNVFFGPCQGFPSTASLSAIRVEWGGMNYHMPHASLWYVFSEKVTFKAGWRWYGYNLKAGTFTDYKAHVVATSVELHF